MFLESKDFPVLARPQTQINLFFGVQPEKYISNIESKTVKISDFYIKSIASSNEHGFLARYFKTCFIIKGLYFSN